MIQRKIALVGAPGVGKTSLVRRFVDSLFDDRYLTTIGVKVDKKALRVGAEDVTLMIWDIAGAEDRFSVPSSYLKGAAGYLVVVDGTRPETLDTAAALVAQVERDIAELPFVIVLNKQDLPDWRSDAGDLSARGVAVVASSAKTGGGVDEAFQRLAAALI